MGSWRQFTILGSIEYKNLRPNSLELISLKSYGLNRQFWKLWLCCDYRKPEFDETNVMKNEFPERIKTPKSVLTVKSYLTRNTYLPVQSQTWKQRGFDIFRKWVCFSWSKSPSAPWWWSSSRVQRDHWRGWRRTDWHPCVANDWENILKAFEEIFATIRWQLWRVWQK